MLIPTLLGQYGQIGVECKSFNCVLLDIDLAGNQMKFGPNTVRFPMYILFGISVLILNIATYFQVSRKAKKIFMRISVVNKDAGRKILEKERSVGKTVALLTAAFFIVYYPYAIFMELEPTASSTHPKVHAVLRLMVFSIVLIDPLVCVTCQEKYREEIKIILRSICGFSSKGNRHTDKTHSTSLPRSIIKQ
jgi:hypothetical protein